MIGRFGRFGAAIIVLAALQTLVLVWMAGERISLLRSSDVVTLKTEPVDPRDLFRGDYVTLGYAISRLSLDGLAGDKDLAEGDTVYVEIAPASDTWRPVGAWRSYPKAAEGNKVIRGVVTGMLHGAPRVRPVPGSNDMEEEPCKSCTLATVSYGIESYFVPEGKGRELERERNDGSLSVDVALAGDGEAAIKGVRLDGELLYEEPLL